MNRILLVMFYSSLTFTVLRCMQKEDQSIVVKLNDNTIYTLSPFVIQQSRTLYTKYLWKERLAINPQKPIICSLSPSDVKLFNDAVQVKKESFHQFYTEQLKKEQRINLINISGKQQLNAPQLMVLLAIEALPEDIVQKQILPLMDRKHIADYIKNNMLRNNLLLAEIQCSGPHNLIFQSNGTFHEIPTNFLQNPNKSTNYPSIPRYLIIKKEDTLGDDVHLVISAKQINNCSYFITQNKAKNSTTIWHIKHPISYNNSLWQYIESDIIAHTTYPFVTHRASFSPKHPRVILTTNDNVAIVTLGQTQPIIKHLPHNLSSQLPVTLCSSRSSLIASLSYDLNTENSRLLLYDPDIDTYEPITFYNTMMHNMCFNLNNTVLYILGARGNYSSLFICNVRDLFIGNVAKNVYSIPFSAHIISLAYSARNKLLAFQSDDGSIKLLQEPTNNNDSAIISLQTPYPDKYSSSRLLFLDKHNILISCSTDIPYFTLWDIPSKICIGRKNIQPKGELSGNIVVDEDEASFLTHNGSFLPCAWKKQVLWTSDELATIQWIKTCPSLLTAYILHRLYKAHHNEHSISFDQRNPAAYILEQLPINPHNIKKCIEKYLVKKSTQTTSVRATIVNNFYYLLDNVATYANEALDELAERF